MRISILSLLAANAVFASPIVKRQAESVPPLSEITDVLPTEVIPTSVYGSDFASATSALPTSMSEAVPSAAPSSDDDDDDDDDSDSTAAPSAGFDGELAYPCPAGSRLVYVENQTSIMAPLESVISSAGYFWNSSLFNITMPEEAPEELNSIGETRQVSLGVNEDLAMEVLVNATTDIDTLALQLVWNLTDPLTVLLAEVPTYSTVQQIYLNDTASTEDGPVTTIKLFSNICAATDNADEIIDFFQIVFGDRLVAVAEEIESGDDSSMSDDVPTVAANEGASALVEFLTANLPEVAQTLATTQNITLFAPNDEAVAAVAEALMSLPSDEVEAAILQHVVSGEFVAADITDGLSLPTLAGPEMMFTVNDTGVFVMVSGAEAQVVDTDNMASNGIVHIIDAVLVSAGSDNSTTEADVPTTIANNGGSALVDFLTANLPDVAETLATTQNITVFAPNNEAVAAVSGALMSLPTDAVSSAIQQHVLSGEYFAANITDGLTLPTLAGPEMMFTVNDTGVFVMVSGAEAQVVDTDYEASNGIVHFIDAVLVNPGSDSD